MRIVVLTLTSAWGGAEVHTVSLVRELASRGHRVSVVELGHDVYTKNARLREIEGVELLRFPYSAEHGFATLYHGFQRISGDICLFAKCDLDAGTLTLEMVAKCKFGRYVTLVHSIPESPPPWSTCRHWPTRSHFFGIVPGLRLWWYNKMLRINLKSQICNRIICVSGAVKNRLLQLRLPAHKLITVRNGTEIQNFRPSPERRDERLRAWGISPGALVFGSVGRLSEEKGLDTAIEVFTQLSQRLPDRDIRLVLAGDGPLREHLIQTCALAGLRNRVIFLGHIPNPCSVYHGFDYFLLPSRIEAISLSLMEALSSGCPAIAMDVGGVSEVMTSPVLGWLVPPGDTKALLGAMLAAASTDRAARHRMGVEARNHIVRGYDAKVCFSRIADIIEEIGLRHSADHLHHEHSVSRRPKE